MVSDHEFDPFIEDIAGELRRPVRFDSSFESRVMASLDPSAVQESMDETKPSAPWLLRPRTFYVSPLAGLAVAAGLVAIITMSVLRTSPNDQVARADDAGPELVLPGPVSSVASAPAAYAAPFTYIVGRAKSVAVVGSFNDWDATKNVLTRTSDSVWTANVGLMPGRYEYQLVVDGKLITDPGAQQSAKSEFGLANSVLIVSPVPR